MKSKPSQALNQRAQEEVVNMENNLVLRLIDQQVITKESLGIDEKMARQIYEKAYQLYQAGKYKEAQSLFTVLLLFNDRDPTFLFGLAACYFMLKDYSLAAKLYLQSGGVDPGNPLPFYYAANCYWQTQDMTSAFALLHMVIKTAGDRPEYRDLKGRSQMMLESVAKSRANNSNPSDQIP